MMRLFRLLKQIRPGSILSWVFVVSAFILGDALYAYSHTLPILAMVSAAQAAPLEVEPPASGVVDAAAKPAATGAALRWGDGVLQKRQVRHAPAVQPQSPASLRKQPPRVTSAATSLETAWQAYRAGHYDLARERYQQVFDGDNNVDVQLGLAAIAVRQNRSEYAMQHYQRALSLDPRNATALAALATLGDARHAEDTEAKIRQLLEQQPSAVLQFSLGNLYADQQRWREAEAAYFASYQADSRNADYAYNLAVSLDYLLQYPAALTYYQKARELALTGGWHMDTLRIDKRIQQLQGVVSSPR